MQFVEGLSDGQAADAVRGRLGWKYLLGLELTDSGFDYSVLSEFRDRSAFTYRSGSRVVVPGALELRLAASGAAAPQGHSGGRVCREGATLRVGGMGASMGRYVHHELMGVTMAVCSSAISALVAFGVHGIPTVDGSDTRLIAVYLCGFAVCWLLLAGPYLGYSEVRIFRAAVPLNDPEAALPARGAMLHRLVDSSFLLFLLLPSLIAALFWTPWAALFPLTLSAEWLLRACIAAHWERRHGLLLWRGEVKEQPLGKGQLLYSSVRPGSPTR